MCIPVIPSATEALGAGLLGGGVIWGAHNTRSSSSSSNITALFPDSSRTNSDDFCERRQSELMKERNQLEDFERELYKAGFDEESGTA